jgi:hypothetical protein
MTMMLRNRFCFFLGFLVVVAFAGGARAQVENGAEAQCGALFGAKVCTSYEMRAGKITELTLRVPVALVEHAPAHAPMVWPPKPDLDVPFAAAVQKQTGFTYANIYWNPMGHAPGAYMVPHFDVHFYFAPERVVEKIDCKNTVKPRALPADYVLPDENVPHIGEMVGVCIPAMGMHALPAADLNVKTPWKASMIVGYYGGKATFFEPMIASATLLQKHSFTLPVPQDIEPTAHVRYPREFRAVYLPKSNVYDFTFFF